MSNKGSRFDNTVKPSQGKYPREIVKLDGINQQETEAYGPLEIQQNLIKTDIAKVILESVKS